MYTYICKFIKELIYSIIMNTSIYTLHNTRRVVSYIKHCKNRSSARIYCFIHTSMTIFIKKCKAKYLSSFVDNSACFCNIVFRMCYFSLTCFYCDLVFLKYLCSSQDVKQYAISILVQTVN